MLKGNILIAQGGGPTAVINESVVGVILESRRLCNGNKIYGARYGIRGILEENFIDLSQETSHNLELIAKTPSSVLGSTRDYPSDEYCEKITYILQKHDIKHLFYIGGNDTSRTLNIINKKSSEIGHNVNCIHIPKTVDNDLVCNDHTPGFPSAARFIVNIFMGINLDLQSLPGIYIGVVMGRDSGFLTAAAALAKKYTEDGPHLIYIPEHAFCIEEFKKDVKDAYKKYGHCVVAVSEGIKDKDGNLIAKTLCNTNNCDQHGNYSLASVNNTLSEFLCSEVKKEFADEKIRLRAETLGLAQRSYPESISDVDQREAREVGEKAVKFANKYGKSGSVAIERTGFYSVDYNFVDLEKVAGKTKFMPSNFFNADKKWVTNDYLLYLRPLLGSKMPEVFKLRKN